MGYRRQPKLVDGHELWECTRCGEWFAKESFYAEKRSKFGIKSECKKCHIRTSIESRDPTKHRITNREWMRQSDYARRPEVRERERMRSKRRNRALKAKCRDIFNDAIQYGIIEKPTHCPRCGCEGDIEGHHDSYYRPLEVKWYCPLCHAEHHGLGVADRIQTASR